MGIMFLINFYSLFRFSPSEGIIVIGATNFVKTLDPALIRAGRFDKRIDVPLPDVNGREEILKLYLKNVPHGKLDLNTIAKKTRGFSGAQLENLVNIAAITASKANKNKVGMEELDQAFDRIVIGLYYKI